MAQPIPRKILNNNPKLVEKKFTTLLIDGSNLLELSISADRRMSSNGKIVGGIYQFLLQLKIMLKKANFEYVYVFWDGDRSGQLRFNLLPEYKSNRDKNYDDTELSDYMKEVNKRINYMKNKFSSSKIEDKKTEKEIFFEQRTVIMDSLEELFIRQCMCDEVEADDLIAYYVANKKNNERIVIMSNDRDLTQLISDDVIVYIQDMKKFINTKNHTSEIGYNYQNVLLKKVLCGDTSDNIKGIKLFGEKTLFNNFSDIKTRKVTLEEVILKAKKINNDRVSEKKKPLQWAKNIVEIITDSSAGTKLYEINKKIIDLKNPLLTKDAECLMRDIMYTPLDPDGRSLTNLYNILTKYGVEDFSDENTFSNFFIDFQYIIEKEKRRNMNV